MDLYIMLATVFYVVAFLVFGPLHQVVSRKLNKVTETRHIRKC